MLRAGPGVVNHGVEMGAIRSETQSSRNLGEPFKLSVSSGKKDASRNDQRQKNLSIVIGQWSFVIWPLQTFGL